jgi:uncharacterized membrane protein SirB2
MDLLPLFQWCEESGLGRTVRESVWAFALIESVHLLALAMIGGAVLLVDLRMLSLGMRQRPVRELAAEAQPFLNTALVVLVISGIGLFASEAVKCYYSVPFTVKISTLVVAILFTFTIRRRVAFSPDSGRPTQMAVALVSLSLWFVVAAAGRWIGFSG